MQARRKSRLRSKPGTWFQQQGVSRRAWLLSLSGLGPLRGAELRNISFPLQEVPGAVTPADRFFVRDHFPEPELSLSTWRLRIEGRVARPYEMTFSDLLESPTRKAEAVLECAGNAASGSMVGNGVWEGVPLSHLLEQAGPAADAAYILLEGADSGRLFPDFPGMPYSQLVPLGQRLQSEGLVVFKLNDRFLPASQGFPARALLPGWYGMAAVKWLQRVVVLSAADKPGGFYESGMDLLYVRVLRTLQGRRTAGRVAELLVKSVIAYPSDGARLPAGNLSVWGFAWTGGSVIQAVELSTDGGGTWSPAKLHSSPKPLTWVRWSYVWVARPGEHLLMSRASDQAGRQQPLQRDPGRVDGYELNSCAPLRCWVR